MRGKSKGFTLVETIIALAILAIATSAIYLLLSNSTSIINKTEVKSELQQESQVIQERFSTIGMQASGVVEVTDKKIVFKSIEEINSEGETIYYWYTFYLNGKEFKLKKEEFKGDSEVPSEKYNMIIGKNVESFEIMNISNNNILIGDNLEEVKGIKVVVKLSREKGNKKEVMDSSTMINFRNK